MSDCLSLYNYRLAFIITYAQKKSKFIKKQYEKAKTITNI